MQAGTGTGDRQYWDAELETASWQEVEQWQAAAVAPMMETLRGRSPLYARLHADCGPARIRAFDDLQSLPFTSKADIGGALEAADEVRPFGENQCASTADIVQILASSGTTGRPFHYPLTRRDSEVWADAIAQNFFTAGMRKSDVVAHLVGLPMVAGGLPYADGIRRIGATLCWLGGFPTERILREMCRLRATAFLSTTSFGVYLAEQMPAVAEETGVEPVLRTALCGGEPGLNQPEIRERITTGLGLTRLSEMMGLGDVLSGLWAECACGDGMHFTAQRYVAVELIDPDSGAAVPWQDGATGELVYTTFAREAAPVVRYRSRDHAVVTGTRCACGRTAPRIRCIGRTDDMLIYKGMNVFPSAIRDLVAEQFAGRAAPLVRVWKETREQVRFDDPIAVDVEAVGDMPETAQAALAKEIEAAIRSRLQVRVAVTVLPAGGLPRSVYKNSLIAIRDSAG